MGDYNEFFEKVDQKYGGKNVSKFMVGFSFGGLIATEMSIKKPDWFKGMTLLAPYFGLHNQEVADRYLGLAKTISSVYPTFRLSPFPGSSKNVKRHHLEYLKDSLMEIKKISAKSIVLNQSIMKRFHEKDVD